MLSRLGRSDPTKPAPIDEDLRRQFLDLGHIIHLDDIDTDEEDEDVLEVSIHNADSLSAFMACSTQWRTQATKQGTLWIGLDYAGCKPMLDAHDFPAQVLTDFPAIEDEVLPLFNDADMPVQDEDEDA